MPCCSHLREQDVSGAWIAPTSHPFPGSSRVFSGHLWVNIMEMSLAELAEAIPKEDPFMRDLSHTLEEPVGSICHPSVSIFELESVEVSVTISTEDALHVE